MSGDPVFALPLFSIAPLGEVQFSESVSPRRCKMATSLSSTQRILWILFPCNSSKNPKIPCDYPIFGYVHDIPEPITVARGHPTLTSSCPSPKLQPVNGEVKSTSFGATQSRCEGGFPQSKKAVVLPQEGGVGAGQKTHEYPLQNFIHGSIQQLFLSTPYVDTAAGFAIIVNQEGHIPAFYRTCSPLRSHVLSSWVVTLPARWRLLCPCYR